MRSLTTNLATRSELKNWVLNRMVKIEKQLLSLILIVSDGFGHSSLS